MPFNLLFRDDIFISYSRGDGGAYAAGLADKLTAKKFSCFIDKLGTEPDKELPASLKKKIRNCTLMVLVGTERGATSRFVAEEITEFKKTKRTIVPVDFGGAVGRATWYKLIPGLAAEPEENPKAMKAGEPSPNVISRIEKSFNYTRRNMRMMRLLVITTAVLLTLIAASIVAAVVARDQTLKAAEETKRIERLRYVGDVKLAEQRYLESSDTNALAGLVTRYEPKPGARDVRGFEFYYFKHLLNPETFRGRHAGDVVALKFSKDGRTLAAASSDFKVSLWDAMPGATPTGEPPRLDVSAMRDSYAASYSDGLSLDFGMDISPGGDSLAFINGTKLGMWRTIGEKLWEQNAPDGERRPLFRLVSFLPDGKLLATLTEHVESNNEYTLELRDVRTGAASRTLKIGGAARYAFSPDGKLLATTDERPSSDDSGGSTATTIKVLDVATGNAVGVWDVTNDGVFELAFSGCVEAGCGGWLALQEAKGHEDATYDIVISTWKVGTGKEVSRVRVMSDSKAPYGWTMALSPDGRTLAAGADRGEDANVNAVRLWDTAVGEPLGAFRAEFKSVTSVEFSPDGRTLATGSFDKAVRLWPLTNETLRLPEADKYEVMKLRLSPDGKSLVGESATGEVLAWDASGTGRAPVVSAGAGDQNSAVSLDGGRVVREAEKERAVVRDARTGDVLFEPAGAAVAEPPVTDYDHYEYVAHHDRHEGVELSPDGGMLAATNESPGGGFAVRVWNVVERRHVGSLRVDTYPQAVRFSHDGRRLAVIAGGVGVLWNPQSNPDGPGATLAKEGCDSAAFSWDSAKLAVGMDNGDVKIWSVTEPTKEPDVLHPTYTPEHAGAQMTEGREAVINGIDFSHDGERVAVVYSGRLLRIWDVATTEQLIKIEDPWMEDVSFLPDGRSLMTFHSLDTVSSGPASHVAVKLWPPRSNAEGKGGE
ncbi:MAG TPA: TIR domain-containing protein [Pyrinomonadaceae bacterium]|nr:TIR domain-containing protein [Pyrinomonadaceae bacterium]